VSDHQEIKPLFNPQGLRFVAIDSGTNGAICTVSLADGKISLFKLNGLLPDELGAVLDRAIGEPSTVDCVVIEQPPYFMGTMIPSARIAVLFESFGIMVGYLMAKGHKVVRVTPKAWQKRLNDILGVRGKMKHSEWKKILADYAKNRYEGTQGLTGQTADALLIAEWWSMEGRFNYSQYPQLINNEENPTKKNIKTKSNLKKEKGADGSVRKGKKETSGTTPDLPSL
jgi:hypothetical protein